MLPKSFSLSDDEESVRSIPRDDCDTGYADEGPISLNEYSSIGIELPHLSWHGYCNNPTSLVLANTGETVSISGKWKKERPYVAGGPLNGSYLFSQIHFHWPSEHLLNEKRYDLEMHAVHYKAAYLTEERAMKELDGTVVLVYLFEVGKDTTSMSKLTSVLSKVKNRGNKTELTDLKLNELIKPFVSNYFIYWGSATISGSDYSLQWIISCSRLSISQNEELFRGGEGEPPRKQLADSKPTSAGLYLVGATVNAVFAEGNRSEVRFSDMEESPEAPEKSRSCCFLAKYRKNSSSKTRDCSSTDGYLEKLYPIQSLSQSSRECSSLILENGSATKIAKKNNRNQQQPSSINTQTSLGSISTCSKCKCKQSTPTGSRSKTNVNDWTSKSSETNAVAVDRCSSGTSNKEEDRKGGKRKKLLKRLVRKNETTHDCIGNGCENQVCSSERDKNSTELKSNDLGERETGKKEKKVKRKCRGSSKFESSSEDEVGTSEKLKKRDGPNVNRVTEEDEGQEFSDAAPVLRQLSQEEPRSRKVTKLHKGKAKKEAQAQVNTVTEEAPREMGQHHPIILAPATIGEDQYIMKSVGTMTAQPLPPSYINGTDLIGEGSDFSEQETSISCSQIWNRENENQRKVPATADKTVNVPDREELEDLELLPIRRQVTEEGVQVDIGLTPQTSTPPAKPVSEDEQSINSVLAILAGDPSLGKVVANLSSEVLPTEGDSVTIQSLTSILSKIAEDGELVDLLRKVSGSDKASEWAKAKETENSAKSSVELLLSSDLDNLPRETSVQTESVPSISTDSKKSNVKPNPTESISSNPSVTAESKKSNVEPNPNESISSNPSVAAESKKSVLAPNPTESIRSNPSAAAESKKSHVEPNPTESIRSNPSAAAESKKSVLAPNPTESNPSNPSVAAESKKSILAPNPTESIRSNPSAAAESKKSNVEPNPTESIPEPEIGETKKSKHSFVVNILTEITKDPTLVVELFKTSKETPLAGMIAEALRKLERTTDDSFNGKPIREAFESANAMTQTLSRILPKKASKTFSGSSNIPRKVSGESYGSGKSVKSRNSRDSAESGSKTSSTSKFSKTAESNQKRTGESESPKNNSQIRFSKASEIAEPTLFLGDSSSCCFLEKNSKNLESLSSEREQISLAKVLSKISKDSSLAKDLASIFRNKSLTADADSCAGSFDVSRMSSSSKAPLSEVSKIDSSSKIQAIEASSKPSGGNVSDSQSEGKIVIEVLKKVSTDHNKVAELAKGLLLNLLNLALTDRSPTRGSLSSLKKISTASIGENRLSSAKNSKQSILSRKESLENRKDGLTISQISSNRSAQSVAGDQQPILELSPSREEVLVEIIEKICEALPGTAELVKNISWVDILITALIDSSSSAADRSPNQSLVTLLDRLSTEPSPKLNHSRREIRNIRSDKSKSSLSSKLKLSSKPGSGAAVEKLSPANLSDLSGRLKDRETSETLIETVMKSLKKSISDKLEEEEGNSEKPSLIGSEGDEAESNVKKAADKSRTRPSIADGNRNFTSETSDADVFIEVLNKREAAAEITMSLKNPFVVQLLESITKDSSNIDNAKYEELPTTEIDETKSIPDSKETPKMIENPSAVDRESENAEDSRGTFESLKFPTIFTASDNVQMESFRNPENAREGVIADKSTSDKEKVELETSLTKIIDGSNDAVQESTKTDSDPRGRIDEGNRSDFGEVSNRNSTVAERQEFEKPQVPIESIEMGKSLKGQSPGEEEGVPGIWMIAGEAESAASSSSTQEDNARAKESESDSEERSVTPLLETRFLGTVESASDEGECAETSETWRNEVETSKPEEPGNSKKKPMYFISEAIDVDPRTGKKVLTGRFVTDNKCNQNYSNFPQQ